MPTLGTPITADLMKPGSCWKLLGGQNGYARPTDDELATQAAAGRHFKIAAPVHPEHHERVQAVLLEFVERKFTQKGVKEEQTLPMPLSRPFMITLLLDDLSYHSLLQMILLKRR